jgi:hypothetical protein
MIAVSALLQLVGWAAERTVVLVRRTFSEQGLIATLTRKPRDRPPTPAKLDGLRLKELVLQSPCNFGKRRSTLTLQLLGETCAELGISEDRVCNETVRKTLIRLRVTWRRAQLWITSPDPQYAQKKARRDRFIRLASKHPDWVLGFLDEL